MVKCCEMASENSESPDVALLQLTCCHYFNSFFVYFHYFNLISLSLIQSGEKTQYLEQQSIVKMSIITLDADEIKEIRNVAFSQLRRLAPVVKVRASLYQDCKGQRPSLMGASATKVVYRPLSGHARVTQRSNA